MAANHDDSRSRPGPRLFQRQLQIGPILVDGMANDFNAAGASCSQARSRDRIQITNQQIAEETMGSGVVKARIRSDRQLGGSEISDLRLGRRVPTCEDHRSQLRRRSTITHIDETLATAMNTICAEQAVSPTRMPAKPEGAVVGSGSKPR